MTETVTCGLFELYFYKNLFNPDQNSKLQNDKRLSQKTMETLLNELLSLNKEDNEQLAEQYATDMNIQLQ